jgi:hypothetical protein
MRYSDNGVPHGQEVRLAGLRGAETGDAVLIELPIIIPEPTTLSLLPLGLTFLRRR